MTPPAMIAMMPKTPTRPDKGTFAFLLLALVLLSALE